MNVRPQEEPKLNQLDWINTDSALSQFKHHLILKKIHIPKQKFNEFASNLYRSFKVILSPTSIYVVQIVDSYDNMLFDVAVGFRRDYQAISVLEKSRRIMHLGRESEIEEAEGFGIYLKQREILSKESREKRSEKSDKKSEWRSERRRHSSSSSFSSSSSSRRRRYRTKEQQFSHSRSNSRSRSRDKRIKDTFLGKFYAPLTPQEWGRQFLEERLLEILKCTRSELWVQECREQISCLLVSVRSQNIYNNMCNGVRIGEHYILLLRQNQAQMNGLRIQMKKYLFKAIRSNTSTQQRSFQDLAYSLLNFKDFPLRVVHIMPLDNNFIVTTQSPLTNTLKFIKLQGWKLEQLISMPRMNSSLQDRWFQFLANNKTNH